ncbi:DUF3119 family protein [Leptolyngbya cf. ectocarpi LEGE 11479]|uniref:DUF3119 family protein n=1 Tax=Leptolyngbya cf. ectocarpi LEGE 11479 TaxID=1828722 RepID=A0A928X533_LEPEC|nr:DUF3119 family protein [Leptolyngbya ectocarpi]MBE9066893.1 DUF3119 family protein [Leptolyngbya cf. ectocarpi LEGE 11479]
MATLSSSPLTTTTLRPDYRLSLSVLLIGLCVALFQAWVGLVIALLGLFLVVQTTVIRLTFTATELQVCRGATILRQFPYAEWKTWTVFWLPIPILFYFREVKSIHFLPMLFSPAELRNQLNRYCGDGAAVH